MYGYLASEAGLPVEKLDVPVLISAVYHLGDSHALWDPPSPLSSRT